MKIALLVFLVLVGESLAQKNLPAEFKELLVKGKLKLTLPDDFEVKKNCNDTLASSDVCFRNSAGDIEIRIDIDLSEKPEENYPLLKYYEEGSYNTTAMDPKKFNATEAAAASMRISGDHNIGFSSCWRIWLYKSKTANANVFVLFGKDRILADEEFMDMMKILKFK